MRQRSSAPVRAIAALALVAGFLLIVVVVVASLGGGGGDGSGGGGGAARSAKHRADRHTPKAYVVQSGDTLTSIAHRTGVPVAEIVALNPGIDPQILVSGEKLKLR